MKIKSSYLFFLMLFFVASCVVAENTNVVQVQVTISSLGGYNEWAVRWENGGIEVASTISSGGPQPNPITLAMRVGVTNRFFLDWDYAGQIWPNYPNWPDAAYYKINFKIIDCPGDVSLIYGDGNAPDEGAVSYSYILSCSPYYYLQNVSWVITPISSSEDPSGEKEGDHGDPINIVSKAMHFKERDLNISCPSFDLPFTRFYNSHMYKVDAGLGNGWTHSLNWRLLTYTGTTYRGVSAATWKVLSPGSGKLHWFSSSGTNWNPPFDRNWALTNCADGFELSMSEGTVCRFDTNGFATAISNMTGQSLTFLYAGNGSTQLLTRVEHDNGQFLDLIYSNRMLVSVGTPVSNYLMRFEYNSSTNLIEAIRSTSDGYSSITYSYDPAHGSLTQRVNRVGDAFKYSYSYYTNSLGKIDSKATGMSIGTNNYYQTQMVYGQDGVSNRAGYVRNGQVYYWESVHASASKRVKKIISPTGEKTSYFHDQAFNKAKTVTVSTDGGIYTTTNRYASAHNLLGVSSGIGTSPTNEWKFEWDESLSLPVAVEDPTGSRTEMTYTNARIIRLAQIGDGILNHTIFTYGPGGLLRTVTNANGNGVSFSYDSWGNVNRIEPELGPIIEFSNSRLGYVESVIFQDGHQIAFDVNEVGWVKTVTWPDALMDHFNYDANGNVTSRVDRMSRVFRYEYLPTGKLAASVRSLHGTDVCVRVSYDQQLDELNITDEIGRSAEKYALDEIGRPVIVTNIDNQTMTLHYTVGNLISWVTRFDGTSVSNRYDADGSILVSYPDSVCQYRQYPNGLLEESLTGNKRVHFTYDKLNRLSETHTSLGSTNFEAILLYESLPEGQVTNLSYGLSIGGAVTNIGYISTAFDRAERTEAISTKEASFEYHFNSSNGLISSMVCTNNGLQAVYSYDSLDQLRSIAWRNSISNTLCSFDYARNDVGLITSLTREDGSHKAYSFDGLDRLTGELHYDSSNSVIHEEEISYDLSGNRTTKSRNGTPVSYGLDTGNRLDSWNSINAYSSISIPIIGSANESIGTGNPYGSLWVSNNNISVAPLIEGTNFCLNALTVGLGTQKIVVAICDVAGNTTCATSTIFSTFVTNANYGYSAAGCVTSIIYKGTDYFCSQELKWDGQYQLIEFKVNGISLEHTGYDSLNRRVWTCSDGVTNFYVYDGEHVVAEVGGNGSLLKTHVSGPGVDNWLAMTVHTGSSAITYFYLTDHLGTVHALADVNGAIVESYMYDAWGRVLGVYDGTGNPLRESVVGNNILWQGREYSWKTGFYYFRARWYDPVTGKWLSNDPIGISGGLNQYVFCENNPINFRDPAGLDVLYLLDADNTSTFGNGHAGMIAGSDATGWTYKSYGPYTGKNIITRKFKTLKEARQCTDEEVSRYESFLHYTTTPSQDKDALDAMDRFQNLTWRATTRNCYHAVAAAMKAAGTSFKGTGWEPNKNFDNNSDNADSRGNWYLPIQ